jgi:AraC-like DNA-binding protein
VRTVRSAVQLARGPGFTISAVTCRDDHKGWSEAESPRSYRVVLVRRGRFRRRTRAGAAEIDRTLAYLGVPGEEEHFAHPAGGDVCTAVSVAPALWLSLAGDAAPTRSTVYIDAHLDLAHRRFLAARGSADPAEHLLALLSSAVTQTIPGPTPSSAAGSGPFVAAARAAIHAGHPAARELFPLAEHLGVSPYRLSRAFTREVGVSLTHYRNRVRVSHALDRLEQGETNLATLAADLGFADQSHLTRTLRTHLNQTPTTLRNLLKP